jgi:flagella basal body P-ring formation protein FlgA
MMAYLLALSIICLTAPEKVEQEIKAYVETNFAAENAVYQYDFRRINWNQIPQEFDSVMVFRIGKDSPLGNTVFTLGVYDDNELQKTVPVSIGVTLLIDALVTTTPVNSGDELCDLVYAKRTITGRGEMPLTDLKQVEGKQAVRYIPAGTIVFQSMIEEIPIIRVGDKVKIMVDKGPIKVSADGEARQQGAIGELIRVTNLGSKKIIQAEIIDSLTVVVR